MPASRKALATFFGVLDAGRVEDARHLAEARAVEVGDRDVERLLVEQRRQLLLVEVLVDLAFAQRHLGDRPHPRAGRDPQAAQRRDDAAAGRLGEVEARGLGREEVGDVARDQGAGRGHADEDGAGPGADAGAGFLAQRGVGLVADHDRVGVGDFLVVADEPLVGLDRDRAFGVVAAVEQRRPQPLLVAAVGDLADELFDQVAAVGEDQDAAGAGGLDEADRGDGLAGAGRVLEPEAARGAGVVGGLLDDLLVVVGRSRFLPVLRLFVLELLVLVLVLLAGSSASRASGTGDSSVSGSATAAAPLPLATPSTPPTCCWAISSARVPESASTWCGLSSAPSRSVGGSSEAALQAEQQREVAAPLDRGVLGAGRRARPGRRRGRGGGRSPGPAPRAPPRRAGRARGRTRPHARYRRLKELPPARQRHWSWP